MTVEKEYKERQNFYLVISIISFIISILIFPSLEVSMENETINILPDNLVFVFLFSSIFFMVSFIGYFTDYKEYKIVGKKYEKQKIKSEVGFKWKEFKES